MVQLLGQLTNLSPRVERVLAVQPGRASQRKQEVAAPRTVRQFGNGVIRRAVIRVLADNQAQGRADIRKAIEELLGEPVSVESVCWSLRKGCKEDPPVFERVSYGAYRLSEN